MLAICLDEVGNFEQYTGIKFVGGCIYTGNDYEEEKQRIEHFFITTCSYIEESLNKTLRNPITLTYPANIHMGKINLQGSFSDQEKRKIEEKIRNKLRDQFVNYLKESGKYYFTCYLSSDEGFDIEKRSLEKNILSNAIDLRQASNLYERMMCKLIYNNLFYNPKLDHGNKVVLEIATRSLPLENERQEKAYEDLGYSYKVESNGEKRVYITDQKTFKAALSTKIFETDVNAQIEFEIKVNSIFYREKSNRRKQETTPFLYFADLACDLIKEVIKESNRGPWRRIDRLSLNQLNFKNIEREIKEITNNPFLYWIYSEVDNNWANLVTSFNKEDLISCLERIYEFKNNPSLECQVYKENWIKFLEQKLKKIFDREKMDIYLSQVEYFISKVGRDYERGLFIAQFLWQIIQGETINPRYRYKLADQILRGFNHRGDANAYQFYTECKSLKDHILVEEYLDTVNRAAQIYANSFDFAKAIKELRDVEECLEILKGAYEEIAALNDMEQASNYTLLKRGKVLSSLGQFYSFIRNKGEAEKYFYQALQEFINDRINYQITLSYLLHLYLDLGELPSYEKYAPDYFQTTDLGEQFNNLLAEKDDFKLYVFIKAVHKFYLNKISRELLEKIYSTDYHEKGFKTSVNPWQLIYKHMAFIKYRTEKSGDSYLEKALSTIEERGITIDLINSYSKIQYLEMKKADVMVEDKNRKNQKAVEELEAEIKKEISNIVKQVERHQLVQESFGQLLAKDWKNNLDDSLGFLSKKFTYTYV